MKKPEAPQLADELERYHGEYPACTESAAELRRLHAQRDALVEALKRIESAVDWYLGRSSFTQTTQLKGLEHSASVRKELFASHDEARAVIAAAKG